MTITACATDLLFSTLFLVDFHLILRDSVIIILTIILN